MAQLGSSHGGMGLVHRSEEGGLVDTTRDVHAEIINPIAGIGGFGGGISQSTSGCIRASTVDCCQHGFIPVVVRDAVGDRASGPHEANLFDLQAKYAEVASLADATSYLARLGSNPGSKS